MTQKNKNFHDFCEFFRFVNVSWSLKQRYKDILNPVMVDLSKFLENPESIEHVGGWKTSQPALHHLKKIFTEFFIYMHGILMVFLPEVNKVRYRDLMQGLVHESVDKLPHIWILIPELVHQLIKSKSPTRIILWGSLDILEGCIDPLVFSPYEIYNYR